MKQYEIIPKNWNSNHTDIVSNGNYDYASTYEEAVKIAKKLSRINDRADVELYELRRSDCDSDEEFEDEWDYNRASYLQWIESFEKGSQVPVVYIGSREIWRWNMQGGIEDLKPRKK